MPRRAPGGFNLLPWRPHAIRRLRRLRALEWLAAALAGGVCALGVLGWQAFDRHAVDTQRAALERSLAQSRTPLAEAARLARESEARRAAEQLARQHARASTRFLALGEALARDVPPGVVLQQLTQSADETDLEASAADEAAAAAWLGSLRALPEVEAVSVRELKRGTRASAPRAASQSAEPIRVAAHLVWKGAGGAAATTPRAPGAPRQLPVARPKEAK
ncbi:PilN domain-containing protein [Paraburkholderia acidisoli]|uniref:Fimbrial assembly family protein n=1 Tax=Paraburkholderia acidisoli TaxID=2571748 RepID=A0A7Z2GIQ5_9BURK|nr:PilN domain-containing protein [Paraburkholderia acidisoli]QGZ62522.1 fimbrial assembly family protein [Paraburkholderia acidisoli]